MNMYFMMTACSLESKKIRHPSEHDLMKRKLERVRKALERREREKDVVVKEGPLWDEARTLFKKKELTLEKMKIGSYLITFEISGVNFQTSISSTRSSLTKSLTSQ